MSLFVTSDQHWGHKNIVLYCKRPFKSVEEMNQTMIERWNSVVSDNDTVLHLGDFALNLTTIQTQRLRDKLNGDIILVPGNHDYSTRLRDANIFILDSFFSEGVTINIGNLIFSHRPLLNIPGSFVNVHGHIHDKPSYGKYLNVCVDVTNYTPLSFKEVKKRAKDILNGKRR